MAKEKEPVIRREHVIITTHNGLIFNGYVFYYEHISECLEGKFFDFDEDDGRHLVLNTDTVFTMHRDTLMLETKKKRKTKKK